MPGTVGHLLASTQEPQRGQGHGIHCPLFLCLGSGSVTDSQFQPRQCVLFVPWKQWGEVTLAVRSAAALAPARELSTLTVAGRLPEDRSRAGGAWLLTPNF